MRASRRHGSQCGAALVPVLFAVMAIAGMSAALVTTSLYRQGAARSLYEQERAFSSAMTGLAVAMYELQEGTDSGADQVGHAAGALDGGAYLVTVTPVFAGPGEYTLRASGRFGPATQGVELVVASVSGFAHGLFSRDGITMSGSFSVDSYSADAGSYASQFSVDHAGDNGHIASNGDIHAGGGSVYGNATPGPGFLVTGDPSNVQGSTAPAMAPVVVDPYVYAPPIPASGAHVGPTTFDTGTYHFTQLTVSGGDVITIDGDVTIYCDDKFTVSSSTILVTPGSSLTVHHGSNDFKVTGGGIANPSEAPSKVRLNSATTGKVELSGGSSFHGVVNAPEAQFVSSGGSQLFGAFVTRTSTLSGGGWLHFDTSLSDGGAGAGFQVRSARRLAASGL